MALDAAKAAREVAVVAVLSLLQANGDPAGALRILSTLSTAAPARLTELDCVSLSEQAIRDAMAMRAQAGS